MRKNITDTRTKEEILESIRTLVEHKGGFVVIPRNKDLKVTLDGNWYRVAEINDHMEAMIIHIPKGFGAHFPLKAMRRQQLLKIEKTLTNDN